MRKLKSSVISVCTLAVLSSACLKIEVGPGKKSKPEAVTTTTQVDQEIGSGEEKRRIISEDMLSSTDLLDPQHPQAQKALARLPQAKQILEAVPENQSKQNKLLVGIPFGLIGQESVFGGVFTKITDSSSEELGTLKLTDLSPIHVRTVVGLDKNKKQVMVLVGCAQKCDERAPQIPFVMVPIDKIDLVNGLVMADLSSMGQFLNLMSLLKSNGEPYKLKPVSSATTMVDYSDISTLIFDVKTTFIPKDAKEDDQTAKRTEITARWYLKLSSAFNSSFESRTPVDEVGFFTTERSKTTKITRFDTTENKNDPITYYGKNIPQAFRPYFDKAYSNWNEKLKQITGRKTDVLRLIHVEKSSALYQQLVTGDVRYNIIEWDLDNKASYGGLGPSIANQFTGEILSANILIQGPTIVDLYTKWFGVSERVREFQEQGNLIAANALIKNFNSEIQSLNAKRSQKLFEVKLGNLAMNVRAQSEELDDPIYKGHFEIVPAGMTFDKYMEGYFQEMVAHELGHNLGLRHNFKGNLGAADASIQKGMVSRSIMEYMSRTFRHMNAIGIYDKMAIAYGYAGEAPQHKNWYCTDEDQALDPSILDEIKEEDRAEVLEYVKATYRGMSPECSKSDATSDPFSFWESRLTRALDLLVGRGSVEAPIFELKEIKEQVDPIIVTLANYALSAEATADSWTNFFGKGDRPEKKEQIRAYVIEKMKLQLCDASLNEAILAKTTPEAKKKAEDNLQALMTKIIETNKVIDGLTADELKCQ